MTVKILARLPDDNGLQIVEDDALKNEGERFVAVVELRIASVTHLVSDDEYAVTLAIVDIEAVTDDEGRARLLAELRNVADERKGTPALPYEE